MKNNFSSVYFKDGQIAHATNDGMELLGHFLMSQVSDDRSVFFTKWLHEPQNDSLSSGPYFIEKDNNKVLIEHLENEWVVPFETSKKNMLDIIHHWESFCKSKAHSVCQVGGHAVTLSRSVDGSTFTFNTDK